MRLIDADRLKEQIAERIRTPRSTMEIKKDILPLINAQPDDPIWNMSLKEQSTS